MKGFVYIFLTGASALYHSNTNTLSILEMYSEGRIRQNTFDSGRQEIMSTKIFWCNLPRDLHSYILKWGNFCYNGICQYLSKLHFWVPNQSCGCTIIWNFVIRLFQNALCMKYIEKYEKGIIMHEDKNILSLTLTHQRGFSY